MTYQKAITRSTVTAYVPASDKVTRRCRVIVVFRTILYIERIHKGIVWKLRLVDFSFSFKS